MILGGQKGFAKTQPYPGKARVKPTDDTVSKLPQDSFWK